MVFVIVIPTAISFVFLLAAIIFVLYFINKGTILLYITLGLFGGIIVYLYYNGNINKINF